MFSVDDDDDDDTDDDADADAADVDADAADVDEETLMSMKMMMNGHRCNHPYPYYDFAVCNLLSCCYINVMSIRVCELK